MLVHITIPNTNLYLTWVPSKIHPSDVLPLQQAKESIRQLEEHYSNNNEEITQDVKQGVYEELLKGLPIEVFETVTQKNEFNNWSQNSGHFTVLTKNENGMGALQIFRLKENHTIEVTGISLESKNGAGPVIDVTMGRFDQNGAHIWVHSFNGTAAQIWKFNGDGTIENPRSGKVLDVADGHDGICPGMKVSLWEKNGGLNQQWRIESVWPY